MIRSRLLLAGLATGLGATALVGGSATAAPAAHHPAVKVLSTKVAAPYQLDYAKGSLYVADGGTNTVSRLTRKGLKPLAHGLKGGDVSGVAVNGRGDLAYTSSTGSEEGITASVLFVKKKHGGTLKVDLLAYERRHNPDAGVSYGIDNPTDCQAKAFEPLGGATYKGLIDSHAYSVTPWGKNGWLVGDAGGNDLLKVDGRGHVSTLTVLPRQPTTITADAAKGLGLPDCVVGAVYNFEPVPTDVEVTRHGVLTSLLPGGPEDPSLGARGSVYLVDISGKHCHATKVAGGFLGATNLAVGPKGRIFVAELFAGQVSVIDHGKVSPYVALPGALSLVYGGKILYGGTLGNEDPPAPGTLVSIH